MPFTCPECDRPIPNRKRDSCGYCGAAIPAELLLDESQKERLAEQQKHENRRYEEWKEEEREKDANRPVRSLNDITSI